MGLFIVRLFFKLIVIVFFTFRIIIRDLDEVVGEALLEVAVVGNVDAVLLSIDFCFCASEF